jgi:hypothetical protein
MPELAQTGSGIELQYCATTRRIRCGALVLAMLPAACSSGPPPISYDRGADHVTVITLLEPAGGTKPTLRSAAPVSPLGMFGVIGALGDLQIQSSHEDHYAALLENRQFSPRSLLIADVTRVLAAEGYSEKYVEVARPDLDFLTQYPSDAATASDAYLDIVLMSYGYFALTGLDPYEPVVHVTFRLIRPNDSKALMQGSFVYSGYDKGATRPDPAFDYLHYTDFDADVDRSIKGIEQGLSEAADAIGKALN